MIDRFPSGHYDKGDYEDLDPGTLLTVEEAEDAIDRPVETWPGNCDEVAHAIVDAGLVPGGVCRYGHYRGPVAEGSMFYDRSALGFVRHGWIEQEIGSEDYPSLGGILVIDPTRWAFEDVKPYIYIEPKTPEYDVGGSVLRDMLQRPFPKYDPDDIQIMLWKDMDGPAMDLLWGEIAGMDGQLCRANPVSLQQAVWFANLNPEVLGPLARPLYMRLIELGHAAFIPFDYRKLVLG